MDKNYEEKYHQLEESYWWFYARREAIVGLLMKNKIPLDAKILEIGCSGGPLLQLLKAKGYSNTFGIDLSKEAIEVCTEREIFNTKVMDAQKLEFEDHSFDVIIASDILEHIEADSATLKEWNRVLKKDGILFTFVPAFQSIWSKHDEINHHFRRYTRPQLVRLLQQNNFSVQKASYWNFFLFFPTFVVRKLQKLKKDSTVNTDNLYRINPVINSVLKGVLKIENRILKTINFPVGVSVMAVSRKRK